ncbi:putative claudin-24 [Betta splendens]|uniref:Claudin-24 n=1 Tax=Betta splendens TaxID=158456 RepID=A0A6P7LYB1_BETSP|nr:putative claudin-24 [Betta splendens]
MTGSSHGPVEARPVLTQREEETDPNVWPFILTMDVTICALELLGLFLCAVAWLASLTTTLMSTWLTQTTELLATETFQRGLWEICVVQELGGLECRPYSSLLGLPQDIMLARTLMCVSLAVGLLGFVLTVPALHLVNSCQDPVEERLCKRRLKAAAAVLCLVAGVLGLIPVSHVAHVAVTRFFDETVSEMVPRWEFGDALFCGWTAGLAYLLAGTLLLISCWRLPEQERELAGPSPKRGAPLRIPSIKTRSEYV